MSFACQFDQLDPDTRDYLHAVRRRQGKGTPGVFVADPDPLPWLAVVVGAVVGSVLFVLSFDSTKGPAPTAALQTAAVLLGGWPIWFAVRRFASGTSRWYGGRFKYFDPTHVYDVRGERVVVTDLADVQAVTAGGGAVRFDLGGRPVTVPVASVAAAGQVEDYYAAMAELEGRPDGKWVAAPPAVLGAAAKYHAENGQEPAQPSDTGLEVESLPTPTVAGRGGFGCGGLILLIVAAAGLFAAFYAVNIPLGDRLAFDRAKQGGAPALRAYLLDPAHSARADEARQLLAKAYDGPVARLKAAPTTKPELRDAVVKLLEELRGSLSPLVSIRVADKSPGADPTAVTGLRSELADGIARSVGPELIAFVSPPDDKPAHLTVRYKITTSKPADEDDDRPANESAAVTVEVRPKLDQPPVTASWTAPLRVNPGLAGVQRLDLLKQELARELVGEWRPAPAGAGGGGF
jgi:hypothetical protein